MSSNFPVDPRRHISPAYVGCHSARIRHCPCSADRIRVKPVSMVSSQTLRWRMEDLGNNEVGDEEILTIVLIGDQIREHAATAPCMANLGLAQ